MDIIYDNRDRDPVWTYQIVLHDGTYYYNLTTNDLMSREALLFRGHYVFRDEEGAHWVRYVNNASPAYADDSDRYDLELPVPFGEIDPIATVIQALL